MKTIRFSAGTALVGGTLGAGFLFWRSSATARDEQEVSFLKPATFVSGPYDQAVVDSYHRHQNALRKATLTALPRVSLVSSRLQKRWDSVLLVGDVQFSPNGALLAVAGATVPGYGITPSGAELRSTRTWKTKARIPGLTRIAWAPNSRLFAIENAGVDVWDVRRNRRLWKFADRTGIGSGGKNGSAGVFGPLLFSADSCKLATLGEDPHSKWKLDNGPNTEAAYARNLAIKYWSVSNGKRLLVTAGPWSPSSKDLVRLTDKRGIVDFARVANGASSYAVSKTHPKVYAYSASSRKSRLFGWRFHPAQPYVVVTLPYQVSPATISGNAWIYGGINHNSNVIEIFRTGDQKLLLRLPFQAPLRTLAISPDARTLVVAGNPPFSPNQTNQSRISVYHLTFKR